MWNSRPQKIHLKPFWLFDSAPYFSVCPITPQLWHFGGLPWNIFGGVSSSSPITFSLVLIFFTSEGWKVMKQGKVVRVFFKTGSYFIPWQLKVANITELDINIFWFQFWSHTVKTLSRNHDTQSRRRWNFHRVICQNRSSFVLYWLAWAHQSPFSPGYVNDLNILLLHALVLINRRDSEEGCSKSRDTRCPVYSIAS